MKKIGCVHIGEKKDGGIGLIVGEPWVWEDFDEWRVTKNLSSSILFRLSLGGNEHSIIVIKWVGVIHTPPWCDGPNRTAKNDG